MTKQHFIAAANIIKSMTDRTAASSAASVFAEVALSFNPRFDLKRFMTACGL